MMWGFLLPSTGRGAWHYLEPDAIPVLYRHIPAVCGASHKLCRWVEAREKAYDPDVPAPLFCHACLAFARKHEPDYRPWVVYGLLCPRTYVLRYIGVTSQKPDDRLWQHVSEVDSGGGSEAKKAWIEALFEEDCVPHLVVLETFDPHLKYLALEAEKRWIKSAPPSCYLTNTVHSSRVASAANLEELG